MKKLALLLMCLCWQNIGKAQDKQLASIFAEHQLKGTMVLSTLYGQSEFIHNEPRAKQRFSAASTFKIPNSLIALEEKVIADKNDIIKWNGTQYSYPPWNGDQTLTSAYRISCVWCYQHFARQIGAQKYRQYLSDIKYGHLKQAFNTTTFWLDNGLTISAREQIAFLKKLYLQQMPFSQHSYAEVSDIMIQAQNSDYILRAKTGWAGDVSPQTGWYVGYVTTADAIWFFATNIEITDRAQLPLRKQITLAALNAKGII